MELHNLLDTAIQATEEASKAIIEIYNRDNFETELKGDNSPLTRADKKSHDIISIILEATNIPVLSEEGKDIPFVERNLWEYLWLIDPLDGTKEFINKNGDFTVNIALIHKGKPILGVVGIPVTGDIYYAIKGEGAFRRRDGKDQQLHTRNSAELNSKSLRVVASRSHLDSQTESFISSLREPVLVTKGSSLKFLLLAEGQADVYPRFAPTMEWDTAAAHVIVNEVGLKILEDGTQYELVYNKPDLTNPFFLVH